MNRTFALSLFVGAALAAPAYAATDIHVNIDLAPPPPRVVVAQPAWHYLPEQRVYVVDRDDRPYDSFRFGAYFYIYNDGWWYRGRRWGGPYRAIETRYVPRPIMAVPAEHWRNHPHGMPPGQAKKYYGNDDRDWKHDNGRGHGRGRGHDGGDD